MLREGRAVLWAIAHTGDIVEQNGTRTKLPPEACQFSHFKRDGSLFLWMHGDDAERGDRPIGHAPCLWVKRNIIIAELAFDEGDSFAMRAYEDFRGGILNAFSIAWHVDQWQESDGVGIAKRWSLKEISAVAGPRGANPAARVLRPQGETSGFAFDMDMLIHDDDLVDGVRNPSLRFVRLARTIHAHRRIKDARATVLR